MKFTDTQIKCYTGITLYENIQCQYIFRYCICKVISSIHNVVSIYTIMMDLKDFIVKNPSLRQRLMLFALTYCVCVTHSLCSFYRFILNNCPYA